MADLKDKKSNFISDVVSFAQSLRVLTQQADEIAAFQTDNLFQATATNAVSDADCIDANKHLTAAQVNAVVTVAAALSSSMTAARRAALRQAEIKPL